jgi:hypothetical protein
VRGWGLGGTPPGVGFPTPVPATGSGALKLFFCGSSPNPGLAPIPSRNRQVNLPSVGKLQVAQVDRKTAAVAAASLHHILRADRKALGQVTCEPIHDELLRISRNGAAIRVQSAGSVAVLRNRWIGVYDCGQSGKRRRCTPLWSRTNREKMDCGRSEVESILLGEHFQRRFGPGAEMLDHLGRDQSAQSCRGAVIGTAR